VTVLCQDFGDASGAGPAFLRGQPPRLRGRSVGGWVETEVMPLGGPRVLGEDDAVIVDEEDAAGVPHGVDGVSGQGVGDQEADAPKGGGAVAQDGELALPAVG